RSSDRKREAAKKEPVKKEPAKREAAQKAEAGTGMPGPEAAPALGIADIYESVIENFSSELPLIREGILRQIELAADDFAGVPEEERPLLQRFSLICRLSAEVYIRKLFIEKLLDADL
ncbi:MAG: hypothetical protein IKD92_07255, partial [Lachnospiraceae bacterium]|nr:hypothetical protein [Lachnospiraceae bacterium]